MSIIQEALKRKTEEEKANAGENETRNPAVNTPDSSTESDSAPEPPAESAGGDEARGNRKNGERRWLILLLAIVFIAVAGGGGFFLFQQGIMGMFSWEEDEQSQAISKKEEGKDANGQQSKTALSKEPQSKYGKAIGKTKETLEKAAERVAEGAPVTGKGLKSKDSTAEKKPLNEDQGLEESPKERNVDIDQDKQAIASEESAENKIKVLEIKEEPDQDVAVNEEAESDETGGGGSKVSSPSANESPIWPALTIKGVMVPGQGNRGTVLMGSDMLSVGDKYKEVEVLEVSQGGALLEYKGERKLLHTGQTVGSEK